MFKVLIDLLNLTVLCGELTFHMVDIVIQPKVYCSFEIFMHEND